MEKNLTSKFCVYNTLPALYHLLLQNIILHLQSEQYVQHHLGLLPILLDPGVWSDDLRGEEDSDWWTSWRGCLLMWHIFFSSSPSLFQGNWKFNINTINPRSKPRGLINFMVHNHLGWNRERVEIETINLLNLLIWMGKLTQIDLGCIWGNMVYELTVLCPVLYIVTYCYTEPRRICPSDTHIHLYTLLYMVHGLHGMNIVVVAYLPLRSFIHQAVLCII